MNILLIHQYFLEPNDGGGSRFNEMTKFWVEAGHNVEVLGGTINHNTGNIPSEYHGKMFTKKQQEGVDILRCYVSSNYMSGFTGRLAGYFSFVLSSTIGGLFKLTRKPDIIIVTSPPLFVGISGMLLSFFKRRPLVFEVRDLWPESAIDTGVLTNPVIIKLAYWFEAAVYKYSTLINVLTPAFKKTLIEKKNISPEKVLMIPNASDFGLAEKVKTTFDREAFRNKMGWNDRVVITYVGAHGVANHLVQLLDTAEILQKTNPEVLFVLIGGGPQKEDLQKIAVEKGLNSVQFHDSVPKAIVFEYILGSDFGTSVLKRVDTFKTIYSNKTFDYMACKKPILLAIDGVSRDLVETAKCGTFIEPENPGHFAKVIKSYLQIPRSEWERQGNSGYEYALSNFDRDRLAAKYLEHLKVLTSKS